ncbi:ubiquitin carboxyl-terminal hydrolase Usp2 isoform X2 [Topomyia yanbarensis]|uniref:ubiquitin carboxyl-terminal hydrolase Usp2 isoform X2 n=1 Tax=Topomyia yanbarensis TaxID=2498891 RepID=UPI00273C2C3F|nr:ubiquitin carboxyl-terminal hydrolase Usp2 isoform X2 [Topomyia yanbarensis]
MHVKSAYSTSGSSYISPSSYRYRSSLSDRTSYTNSSTTSSNIYRRSFRYDLPSSSSAYSSYRSDRAADTDLSTSLSALSTKDSAVSSGSTPSTTVNSKDTFSRPSRYSTAYSYSSSSQVPARDYSSSRITSRSSDTRPKDRDNNYLCTGGAGSSSSYISNLRSTALSGAEIYQKYSISTYKPNSFESRIAATRTQPDTSTAALDVSKVNNTVKDRNSNIDAGVVVSNNNKHTNTSEGIPSVANTPQLASNCKLASTNNTSTKSNAACSLNVRSETPAKRNCITGTTVVTTTTTTITTTTSSTSVLLSSSSSSSVLYESTAASLETARLRKPAADLAKLKASRTEFGYPLNKLRSAGKPPIPRTAFTSGSSSDLSSTTNGRKEVLGLSAYRNQNFLKNECDLVKRELSKSATELPFKQGGSYQTAIKSNGIGSATSRVGASVDDSKTSSSSYQTKLEVPKVRQFLPPVPNFKSGQPKDHEDDDKKNHQHQNHIQITTTTTSDSSQVPSARQPTTNNSTSSSTSGVELKHIDQRPTLSNILQCTQRNETSLFKPFLSSSKTTTRTTITTSTTTTITESLTTICSSPPSSTSSTAYTYSTNSRSANVNAMKSLHITSELEEPVAQATIKLRSSLNGTSNGGTGYGSRCIATASATTDDIAEFDYHNVTATIRIKPKSSINHSTSSSSSSSTTSINNINNNANDGDSNNSSSDEHETSNGIVRNNNNCLDNGVNDGGGEDVDEVPSPAATVTINSADKEPKAFDDDKKVSYLRAGTASKSIHSTSPVGYRSRECDSGLSSYRSGLGIAAPSLAVQKSSYNDRTNGEESSETLARGGSRKEGLCGLYNIGNTCFMNSVIQCLSHTRELTNFLRTQSAVERGTVKDHKILAEYIKLIKDMWNGINRSVNPSELKYAFSSKHRMYSGSAQQDAQEFLRFFIDSLHSALNVSIKREPISSAIEDDDLNNRIKADMMWEWYSKVENSVIKDLFVGLLRSTLKCTVCNGCSVTFDPFWDLSLPLPSTNSRCKLENCLDMFVKEEVMDGIDQPTCSRCKTRRKCTKSLTIERFPKYLVIHLKRFSETRWSKLTNVIEFPTGERELNLQPYASEDNTGPVYYSLYGISNHMGSTAGGHYVAVCKHPVSKEWHEFNDNFVSDASERSLVTSSAYVLFYERA